METSKAKQKSFRGSALLRFVFDLVLLLGFVAQAFVAGCLLVYGYIPIPAAWANRLLADKMPEGLHLHISTVHLNRGHIAFTGVEISTTEFRQALLSIDAAEVELDWGRLSALPEPKEISITGGTLYTPPIYAPSGQYTPLLERIALSVKPDESGWQVERLACLHEDIHLWGSVSLPQVQPSDALNTTEVLDNFYTRAATLSGQKARLEHFETPTIVFAAQPSPGGAFLISVDASSAKVNHPEVQAENIRLKGRFTWEDGMWSPLEAPAFSVSELNAPRYQLETSDARIHIPRDDFASLLQGQWPRLQIVAAQLNLSRFKLDAPVLRL
ncbi:MAG: hypothetical protein GVY36_10965, partial [Verrucomicrobia bacterium]|nr:hypothetical protein [Verrucomicrobiota bacterium]